MTTENESRLNIDGIVECPACCGDGVIPTPDPRWHQSSPLSPLPEARIEPETVIDRIVRAVAELPNRTSPDDWPEAMLVTSDELSRILADELAPFLKESER